MNCLYKSAKHYAQHVAEHDAKLADIAEQMGFKLPSFAVRYVGQAKDSSGWDHYAYECSVGSFAIAYKSGLAHCWEKRSSWGSESLPAKPTTLDVLWSMASDASCARDTFDDFCADMGYDTDSRSALETYLACQEQGVRLRKLGIDAQRFYELADL